MEQELQGIVLSGHGGFYEVLLASGSSQTCHLRGKLRLNDYEGVWAGDRVWISIADDGSGMIEGILPRRNFLLRPRIANVDQILAVIAINNPPPDLLLIDKLLIAAEYQGITPLICINKCDLDKKHLAESIAQVYQSTGYQLCVVSAVRGENIDSLLGLMRDKTSLLAGCSGVGKSSLINALLPEADLEVGGVSQRLQRGRHTTRYVSILQLSGGGLIADTPGFSLLDLPADLLPEQLPRFYPEFERLDSCRFDGCLHDKEPDCAVKQAVEQGKIDAERYRRYLKILNELRDREVKY